MKEGWQTVPLETLAIKQKGAIKIGPFGSQLKKCDLVSFGVHVVGIENVLAEKFDGLGERFISLKKYQTLRTVEIFPGDLLVTMMGTIGKVVIVPDGIETSIMDSHLLRIRVDHAICRTDYLSWAIYGSPAVQHAMDAQAHGAIMRGLNSAIVRSLPILLPPLPEQQRIVGILDKVFDGIAIVKANAERNLQNSRALFKSHLQSVFTRRDEGWQAKTLEGACQFSNGLWKGEKPPFVNVGVIRNTNFTQKGTLDDSDIAYLDVELKKLEKRRLQFGDIILEKSGGGPKQPVGRVALFDKKDGDFSFSNFTAALRVLDPAELNFRFLHHFLYWIYISGVTEGMQSNSTGIRNLDGDAYKAIIIKFPSLPEQQRLVGVFDAIFAETQRLESIYEQKLTALEALKKSMLHQAFSGEL